MVRPERFELPTLWFVAKCSIQLSYGRGKQQAAGTQIIAETLWLTKFRRLFAAQLPQIFFRFSTGSLASFLLLAESSVNLSHLREFLPGLIL